MRYLLIILVILLAVSVSLSQEEIYFPQHEGMTGARWSPDGKFIATWGESPLVQIWNDHDGSLALELDHGSIDFVFPNGDLRDSTDEFSISSVGWSDDMQFIITTAQPDFYNDYFDVTWTSNQGKPLYYYYSGTWRTAWHPYEFHFKHQVIPEHEVVASWYSDTMSFIDTNPASDSVGEELASIDFSSYSVYGQRLWRADRNETLLYLYPKSAATCENCTRVLRLYDVDLSSETFGEYLWQTEAQRETQIFAWPNIHGLLATHHDNIVEVWDLDRESMRFGSIILRIKLTGDDHHDFIYEVNSRRLIIPEVKENTIKQDERLELPDCFETECEFHIGVWDLYPESASYKDQLYVIHHAPYKYFHGPYFTWGGISWLNLNLSQTQVHVHTPTREDPYNTFEPVSFVITAYSLDSGEPVEARESVAKTFPNVNPYYSGPPQVDFENSSFDEWHWEWRVMDLHPAGSKVIVRLSSNHSPFNKHWFVQNIETGEYFYPPDTWREQWGHG